MNAGRIMNCPGCGNQVAANGQFCPKCFARLEPPGLWRRLLSLFQSADRSRPIIVNVNQSVTIETVNEAGERHEYHSLDEVPPELRAEFEQLQSEAMKGTGGFISCTEHTPAGNTVTSRRISTQTVSESKLMDAPGNERVYPSLEELPPEIRAQVEAAQKQIDAQQ